MTKPQRKFKWDRHANSKAKYVCIIQGQKQRYSPAELQRIVNMDRIPNIFVFENLMNTE